MNVEHLKCRGCLATQGHHVFSAREMMFGMRDQFQYFECGNCGALQICDVPTNLSKYYPSNYYSLSIPSGPKRFLQYCWASASYGKFNPIGSILSAALGRHQGIELVARLRTPKTASILDVGCGGGDLLMQLHHLGFTNLTGVDPFLQEDAEYSNGLRVYKREVDSVEGSFDLVMFHHSLEHVLDPRKALKAAIRLLAPGGKLVVRIPVAGTYGWRTFRENWVALDPPRHIFVPTAKSIEMLSKEFGLRQESVVYESDEFLFWASEQYQRDIPIHHPESLGTKHLWRFLPNAKIRGYRRKVRELNESQDSDTACFVFSHV